MTIEEVKLWTNDLSAQRAFYAVSLGLPIVEFTAERLTVHVGTSRLTFTPAPSE